jgi:hypothetical protein
MAEFPGFGKKGGWDFLSTLAGNPESAIALVVVSIVVLVVMGLIAVAWGILTFLGTFLMLMAFVIIVLNRGSRSMSWMFILVIALGGIFIGLGMMGVGQGMQVDLRVIPGMQFLHDLIGLGG